MGVRLKKLLRPTPLKVILAMLALILAFAIPAAGAWMVQRRIATAVQQGCASCAFELERLDLKFFPFRMVLVAPHISGGDPNSTAFDVRVSQIDVRLPLARLVRGEALLDSVEVAGLRALVTEGDASSNPPMGDGAAFDTKEAFEVGEVILRDGEFTYSRVHAGRRAVLSVREIAGRIDRLGTVPELRGAPAHGQVTGLLERSGRFALDVTLPLFTPGLRLDIDLRMEGLRLAELNSYFRVADGVKLSGTLAKGQGLVSIRHRQEHARVIARYHGLDIVLEATDERSGIAAFFANLFSKINARSASGGSVRTTRQKGETIFRFIFRGLRDAALEIVTS